MSEALKYQDSGGTLDYTPTAAVSGGEVVQLADGQDGRPPVDIASGALGAAETEGVWTVAKTASMVFLQGGPVWWDHSANKAHFKQVSDRDFYLGVAYDDAASADTTMKVILNARPQYKTTIEEGAYQSVLAGTAAAGGFGYPVRLGGAQVFELTATNEAQKVDALSVQGWSVSANAIVEGAFRVLSDGAGTVVDVSIGVASATHATDADSIAESAFIHLDANNTNINAECDDGTNETAATDTTTDYTEGTALASRVEFWIDMRDLSSLKFYVEGARVLSGTTFNMSAAAGPLFLLVHVEKTASTDTYKIAVDWLRVRIMQEDAER